MDLYGNTQLLDAPLVAFFASRTAPPEALALALRWAHEIARTNRVVISGFHSPIERAVLEVLFAHRRPVVLALGRSLYRRLPARFQVAFDEQQLLMLSFRRTQRANVSNSQMRNWAIADMAAEIVFAPFAPDSQLSTLCYTLRQRGASVRLLG